MGSFSNTGLKSQNNLKDRLSLNESSEIVIMLGNVSNVSQNPHTPQFLSDKL